MATTLGGFGSLGSYDISGSFSSTDNSGLMSSAQLSQMGNWGGSVSGASSGAKKTAGFGGKSWMQWVAAAYEDITKTVDVYYSAKSQKNQLKAQAQQYIYQANQATQNARAATNDMYNAYRMGEYQAMQQGLQDAKIMSHARAQAAGSGVQMNSGSKKEVNQSNQIAHEINQNIIQMNTTSSAMRASLESANYQAQALISNANARATQIMADSINPLSQAVFASFMFAVQRVANS